MKGTLTEIAIKNAKPGNKRRTIFDGGGLFIVVEPTGGKLWRFPRMENSRSLGISQPEYCQHVHPSPPNLCYYFSRPIPPVVCGSALSP